MTQRLSRCTLALIALAYAVFCVYGSWVPLEFKSVSVEQAWQRFRELPYLQIGMQQRADWVANLLLFVPLGFFCNAVLHVDRPGKLRFWLSLIPLCLVLVLFSCVIEFTQAWFPKRTMSINDIIAESIGGLVGSLAWLAIGQSTIDLARQALQSENPRSNEVWWLAYCAGFLVYQLLPLDLTLSLHEIYRKYQDGKIELIPFSTSSLNAKLAYETLRDVVLAVPIGFALTIVRCPVGKLRSAPKVLTFGALYFVAIEFMQLFVVSRFSSLADALLGGCGVMLGHWLARRLISGQVARQASDAWQASRRKLGLATLLCAATLLIPIAQFWFPFNFQLDKAKVKEAYQTFWMVPFAKMYYGTEFNAVSQILAKLLAFVPHGAASFLWWRSTPLGRYVRIAFILAWLQGLAFGAVIELGQLALPGRYPDITDVVLYSLGCCIGFAISGRISHGTAS